MAKINSLVSQKNQQQEAIKGKTLLKVLLRCLFGIVTLTLGKRAKGGEEAGNTQPVCQSLCRRLGAGRKERINTLLTVWRASACHKRESHGKRQLERTSCVLLCSC